MGGVVEKIKRCVTWLGNVFKRVISWFWEFLFGINRKTEAVLNRRTNEILACQEPKKVAKYVGAASHHKQTKKIADHLGKDLCGSDKAAADKIIEKKIFEKFNIKEMRKGSYIIIIRIKIILI